MAPGAAQGRAKRWPAGHFSALCRRLARDLGQPCVLLGSTGERALGAAVRGSADSGRAVVDLTGRTDLGALIGVLASAGLFVGNDSGPAHLRGRPRPPGRDALRVDQRGPQRAGGPAHANAPPTPPLLALLRAGLSARALRIASTGSRSTVWHGRPVEALDGVGPLIRRPGTPHIWIHGAGPTLSAEDRALLDALRIGHPRYRLLLTARDAAARRWLRDQFPEDTVLAPPRGGDWRVRRAIGRLRPHALLFLARPGRSRPDGLRAARWWRFPVILVGGSASDLRAARGELLEAVDHFLVPDADDGRHARPPRRRSGACQRHRTRRRGRAERRAWPR